MSAPIPAPAPSSSADVALVKMFAPAMTFRGHVSVNTVLAQVAISSFPKPAGGVVVVPSSASVKDAVQLLARHNILSAPVRDVTKPDDAPWAEKYLGIVDMMDMVAFVMGVMEGKYDGRPSFMESLHHSDAFAATPVTAVLHVFKFGPFVPLLEDSSTLLDAVLILGKHGLHRLCVVQTGGDIVNVITQSAVIKALSLELRALPAASMSLRELGLAVKPRLYSVTMEDGVWAAVKMMAEHGVSAVPVLGAGGCAVGLFSSTDLRSLVTRADIYPFLYKSMREFLAAKIRHDVDVRAPLFAVVIESTLGHVVAMLEALHIHRVVVTDRTGAAVGLVSLSDVLSVLVFEPEGYFGTFFDDAPMTD